MKKFFFIITLAILLFPTISLALNAYTENGETKIYDGLVPCGGGICIYRGADPEAFMDILETYDDLETGCKTGAGVMGSGFAEWQEQNSCQLCHVFVMTNGIIKFVMLTLVPIGAVLMLMIGGAKLFFGGGKANAWNDAKGIITSVVVGLLIIFSAWVIVNTVLTKSGIVSSPSILQWYNISCQ